MRVTEMGQVTIPERIRTAAGIAPGSEVAFSLSGPIAWTKAVPGTTGPSNNCKSAAKRRRCTSTS